VKILVTGATGFLGSWVLFKLSEGFGKEYIIGTGRNPSKAQQLIHPGYEVVTGDLTDTAFISNNFHDVTHVVHCAARSSVWGEYESFYQDNVISTRNLLHGIPSLNRFIYISTPSIYFRFTNRFQIREDSELPKTFVNHYATTKYLAEQEVLHFLKDGLVRVIMRPRAIIGVGDTSIVPRVIRAYKAGRLRIIGDGKNVCDFTSVKNVANAIYLAMLAGHDIDGEVFNITDDKPVALWQLVTNTLEALGYQPNLKRINYRLVYAIAAASEMKHRMFKLGEPVLTRYGVGLLKYSQTLDITRAKQVLGYKPLVTTEESIAEFIESYRDGQ
jgi:2-alkyl-3-oxoalkanoate reductase